MIETGTVVARRDGVVDVATEASAACAGCGACRAGDGDRMLLRDVVDEVGAHPGDTVEVSIPERLRAQAALAIYIVPIAALLAGYLAGFLLGERLGIDPDVTGALGAVTCATAALLAVRTRESALAGARHSRPFVRVIIARGSGRE